MTRFLVLLIISTQAFAQIEVAGRVVDGRRNPISGVNVLIEGTTPGTVSDSNGNFHLEIPADSANLIFSFVGYESQVIRFFESKSVEIILSEQRFVELKRTPISQTKDGPGIRYLYLVDTVNLENTRLTSRVVLWQQEKYNLYFSLDSLAELLNVVGDTTNLRFVKRYLSRYAEADTVLISKEFIEQAGIVTFNEFAVRMIKANSIIITSMNGERIKSIISRDVLWVGRKRKCKNCCWGGIEYVINGNEAPFLTDTHIMC